MAVPADSFVDSPAKLLAMSRGPGRQLAIFRRKIRHRRSGGVDPPSRPSGEGGSGRPDVEAPQAWCGPPATTLGGAHSNPTGKPFAPPWRGPPAQCTASSPLTATSSSAPAAKLHRGQRRTVAFCAPVHQTIALVASLLLAVLALMLALVWF